jgi:hypothetical protein
VALVINLGGLIRVEGCGFPLASGGDVLAEFPTSGRGKVKRGLAPLIQTRPQERNLAFQIADTGDSGRRIVGCGVLLGGTWPWQRR